MPDEKSSFKMTVGKSDGVEPALTVNEKAGERLHAARVYKIRGQDLEWKIFSKELPDKTLKIVVVQESPTHRHLLIVVAADLQELWQHDYDHIVQDFEKEHPEFTEVLVTDFKSVVNPDDAKTVRRDLEREKTGNMYA